MLNAVASLQAYEDADPNRIGMWGHSMGGLLTLRAAVVSQDIKAGVIWSGSIASIQISLNPGAASWATTCPSHRHHSQSQRPDPGFQRQVRHA